jgi:hypothetical protein
MIAAIARSAADRDATIVTVVASIHRRFSRSDPMPHSMPRCMSRSMPVAATLAHCAVRSGARIVPLVELYTSEGCSSCPSADRWLSREIRSDAHVANWLAFHVDYWDDLGWPDRFASPRHTARQQARVSAAGERAVYTPQVMVGTDVTTTWRLSPAFEHALEAAGGNAPVGLALQLRREGGEARVFAGAMRAAGMRAPARVWLAQTRDGESTQVRAGENEGEVLRHDRVVTGLWGPWPLEDAALARSVRVTTTGAWGLTLFVEDAKGRGLQSLRLDAADCR